MNGLESLSQRVFMDIEAGKELHADEQVPAFLYTDVSHLEKQWNNLRAAADHRFEKHKVLG